jgi:hypothetical protein
VDPLHRRAVLPVRQPRALDFEPFAQRINQIVNRPPPFLMRTRRAGRLELDQAP